MYETDGDFGKVRMAVLPELENSGLFTPKVLGWHRVNERYVIPRDEGSTEHILLVTTDGCGKFRMGKEEYILSAGTIALFPRNVPHTYRTVAGGIWEFYWMHPSGELCDVFLDRLAVEGRVMGRFDPSHPYGRLTEEIMDLTKRGASSHALEISMKTSQFLHYSAIDLRAEQPPTFAQQVISYIEQHFDDMPDLDEVARMLYISPAHLIREFKKEMGITPHQYLIRYRLTSAEQLLRFSDLSVEQIGKRVGFSTSSHFISRFRAQYGLSPLQYKDSFKA